MRRSTLRALLVSAFVSLAIGIGIMAIGPRTPASEAQAMVNMQSQIAALREDTRALTLAVAALQARAIAEPASTDAAPVAATPTAAASAAAAPPQPAFAETTSPDSMEIDATRAAISAQVREQAQARLDGTVAAPRTDSAASGERQAAAALEALEQRQQDQRRRLFVNIPDCRPGAEIAMVVCTVTMRNNDDAFLPVSISPGGSRVMVAPGPGAEITSIRMRQLGQSAFGYSAAVTIPGKSTRSIEIEFGPATEAGTQISEIDLTVNKIEYKFTDISIIR